MEDSFRPTVDDSFPPNYLGLLWTTVRLFMKRGRGVREALTGWRSDPHFGVVTSVCQPAGDVPGSTLGPLREILPHMFIASQCGDVSPARVFRAARSIRTSKTAPSSRNEETTRRLETTLNEEAVILAWPSRSRSF